MPQSADQTKLPLPIQVKPSKHKKGSKKKKKNKAKNDLSLATEIPHCTPATDKSSALPEPETPFRTEAGLELPFSSPPRPVYGNDRRVC